MTIIHIKVEEAENVFNITVCIHFELQQYLFLNLNLKQYERKLLNCNFEIEIMILYWLVAFVGYKLVIKRVDLPECFLTCHNFL